MNNAPKSDFVFGVHAVAEALNSGNDIEKILIAKDSSKEAFKEILHEANQRKIPVQSVPAERFNKYTRKNHQGVLAFVSAIQYASLDNIISECYAQGKDPFILVLDEVTDVRNFGAIARTAECAGVHAIVIPSKGSAQITSDAVKTSSGALNFIPVCRTENLKSALKYLKESGLKLVACTEKAEKSVYEGGFNEPLAIVMGSEERGIHVPHLALCDEQYKIPMFGQISSMNVSVATGIIVYEAIRQKA